jgi:transcription initiation factor IIE alpha subunit
MIARDRQELLLRPLTAEREVAAETLAAALTPHTSRTIQDRLERLLLDDRELLISLQCQLEQIRREFRLLNDARIVQALDARETLIRH